MVSKMVSSILDFSKIEAGEMFIFNHSTEIKEYLNNSFTRMLEKSL